VLDALAATGNSQDTGRQDRRGQHKTGELRTGQDRTGQDTTGGVSTEQAELRIGPPRGMSRETCHLSPSRLVGS
jgi:hypothetical protein